MNLPGEGVPWYIFPRDGMMSGSGQNSLIRPRKLINESLVCNALDLISEVHYQEKFHYN